MSRREVVPSRANLVRRQNIKLGVFSAVFGVTSVVFGAEALMQARDENMADAVAMGTFSLIGAFVVGAGSNQMENNRRSLALPRSNESVQPTDTRPTF